MRKRFLLTAILYLLLITVHAGTPRALIIGIDLYKPPAESTQSTTRSLWRNLNGCVNDAEAMKTMIMAKYGFSQQHIHQLYNQEASRENILSAIQELLQTSQKGDAVLIFYAGHGSQVVNSLSAEQDQRDETIVPADAYKGAADIRDKELAALFNRFLDKGVVLTVIFDSCHSGSAGRGLFTDIASRYLEESSLDVKDASNPAKPEERGALILSAAQDFEYAKEVKDENNVPHGAFSLALLKAMQQNDAGVAAEDLFSSVKAIMKFYGKTQEPVLAGNETRRKGTLFGLPKKGGQNSIAIAVTKTDANGIELMGGYALGLSEGVKLVKQGTNDTIVVTKMINANRSLAKNVSDKSPAYAPGSLFEVITWSSATAPVLRIYIPDAGIAENELTTAVRSLQKLRSATKANFIADPTKETVASVYQYTTQKGWQKNASLVTEKTSDAMPATKPVFANLPPPAQLAIRLREEFTKYSNIEVLSSPEDAHYILAGRVNEKNELAYTFLKSQYSPADSTESLPVRTEFIPVDLQKKDLADVAEKMAEDLFRVAKIKAWLMLQSPAGQNRFPFALQVQHFHSGTAPVNAQVRMGDTLSFYFVRAENGETWNRKKRYVYLFSIDGNGAMKLIFPTTAKGNVENRLPLTGAMNKTEDKTHLADILVRPPFGYDTYFLLTTEEAISNLSAFQQPGVLSRGPATTKSSIEKLLFTGTKSRNKVVTPMTWSIDKIILKSSEKKN